MFQVQHLVIHAVFDRATRHRRMVEDATYDNRIVSRVVMSETIAGMIAAPGHLRPGQESIKETGVQFVKHFLQIVSLTTGRLNELAAANLPQQVTRRGKIA